MAPNTDPKYTAIITGKGSHMRREDGVKVRYGPGDTIIINEAEKVYHVDVMKHWTLEGDFEPKVTQVEVNLDPPVETAAAVESTPAVDPAVEDADAAPVDRTEPTFEGDNPDGVFKDEDTVQAGPGWFTQFGFTPGTVRALRDSGLSQAEAAASDVDSLQHLRGIGKLSATKILTALNGVNKEG